MECNIYQSVKEIGVSKIFVKKTIAYLLKGLRKDGELSVHFIGDRKMRNLNAEHRGIHRSTDVLSFSAQEGSAVPLKHSDLGDIFISVPYIRRQAACWSVPYKEELTRMLIHGVLHNMGYDHKEEWQAKKMFELQERFLRKAVEHF
ncbi:MAG: rRNA maturation RNase YbeY [Candidatus Magasanikbacteria bacterium]|nr:rRNA maturation RNase YbeY [Candidatus Magasanikbacteria bacterium]